MNQKGVSAVIATIIILAITLVGIGIIMYVIIPMFNENAEDVEFSNNCLQVSIEIVKAEQNSDETEVEVTLKRATGLGDESFDGVKINALNNDGEIIGTEEFSGNIGISEGNKIITVSLTGENPESVEAFVYFLKESGEEYICSQSDTETII